jgi:starch phosphorylase
MKFALNGALTIGTLDGANVEIREEVGAENFFLFGLTVEEASALRASYRPWEFVEQNPELRGVLDAIGSGVFSRDEPGAFRPVIDALLHGGDPFLLLADFAAYVKCQEEVSRVYRDEPDRWTKMAILNVARIGTFSSDRTIQQYVDDVWKLRPIRP